MIKNIFAAFMVITVMFAGCLCKSPPVANPPKLTDQNKCEDACKHIGPEGLNCEEGKPVVMTRSCKEGNSCKVGEACVAGMCEVSCTKFCIDTQDNGVWLNPICVSKVSSCDQIDACFVRKK